VSTFETLRNPHQKILYILCAFFLSFFLSFFRRRARLCRHVCRERCSIFGDARSRGGQREESARNARRWEERLETNDSEKKINVVVVVVVVGNGGR